MKVQRPNNNPQEILDTKHELILKYGEVDSIDQLKQKMIQNANKTFVKNYEDNKPFDRETKISEIPLQVIKWYAYNADDLKKQINIADKVFKAEIEDLECNIKELEINSNKSDTTNQEGIKKVLIFVRSILNDYGIFHKTYISNATRAYTTSVKICKTLTKQLFVKNEN